jgi:parvulin-like peptidyl-prolyl isomerase
MLSDGADRQTRQGIARDYGDDFAQQVAALPRGIWQGPLQSNLGVHLVRVDASDASPLSGFATVREQVRRDWIQQRQVAAQEAAYRELRKRYQVDMRVAEPSGNGGKP